jgi:hypothetical protein
LNMTLHYLDSIEGLDCFYIKNKVTIFPLFNFESR